MLKTDFSSQFLSANPHTLEIFQHLCFVLFLFVCAKNFSSYFIIELFAVVNSGLETKIYDKKSIKPAQKKEQGKIVCLVVFVYAVGRQR